MKASEWVTPSRYRRIMCPDAVEGVMYRAYNVSTGETFLCGDLAKILKLVAESYDLVGDNRPVWRLDVQKS